LLAEGEIVGVEDALAIAARPVTWFHSTQEQVAVAAQDGVRRDDQVESSRRLAGKTVNCLWVELFGAHGVEGLSEDLLGRAVYLAWAFAMAAHRCEESHPVIRSMMSACSSTRLRCDSGATIRVAM
jgi:hypothetical protein